MIIYPWLEAKVTGDKREHHLLDRPRNAPTRTAIGAMSLSFYMLLLIGGGNDVIGTQFDISINAITWFIRIGIIVIPPIVFVITKRICLSLQRADREKLMHGRETGTIMRLPHGEFIEVHAPLSENEKAVILSKTDITPLPWPEKTDADGVRDPSYKKDHRWARLSHWWYTDNIAKPTAAELATAEEHIRHSAAEGAPIIAHRASLEPEGGVLHDPAAAAAEAEEGKEPVGK